MSPEVLIYIQSVKKFFETNEDTKFYFIAETDENIFFQKLGEISQKNFEKDGDPMLSQEQFETLRKTIQTKEPLKDVDENIYTDLGGFGKICLN